MRVWGSRNTNSGVRTGQTSGNVYKNKNSYTFWPSKYTCRNLPYGYTLKECQQYCYLIEINWNQLPPGELVKNKKHSICNTMQNHRPIKKNEIDLYVLIRKDLKI